MLSEAIFGILLYLRFRDDVFIVFEKTEATKGMSRQLVSELQARAVCY